MMRWAAWMVVACVGASGFAVALPQGAQVVQGSATLNQTDPANLTVTQGSSHAILNWDRFDIGSDEGVFFDLPDAGSISLNRVVGGHASSILGRLGSNGQVYLINPQGVMFGAGSQVNVGSLLATTADVGDDAFMAGGPTRFAGGQGVIRNEGTLTVAPYGYVVLAAPIVENAGSVEALQGDIRLAGAAAFTIDPVGDNLLTLAPDPMAFAAHVNNTGVLRAGGGRVALTTQATDAALASVINTSGLIEATTVNNVGGRITLGTASTQRTTVAGTLAANGADKAGVVDVVGHFVDVQTGARIEANSMRAGDGGVVTVVGDATVFRGVAQARGGSQSGNGGFIEISGHNFLYFAGSADTLASNGVFGTLLFDPINITITDGGPDADDAQIVDGMTLAADGGASSFSISEDALEALAAGTNISLEATNNITMDDLTDNVLTLATTGSVSFLADSDGDGNGNFSMTGTDEIVTAGADLTITGAHIQVGRLDTDAAAGGAVALNTTGGTGTITAVQNMLTDGGTITLDGDLALGGDVTLVTGATGAAVEVTGNVVGASDILTLSAGSGNAITLGGDVTLDDMVMTSGGTLNMGGAWVVAGHLDFTNVGAVTLTANSSVNADGGAGNITFDSGNTINGARTLSLTGNNLVLPTAGNSTALVALTTNATAGLTLGNVTTAVDQNHNASTITLGGTLTSNGGDVILHDPVLLSADSALVASAGNVTVHDTINSAGAPESDLAVTATGGTATLTGVIGGTHALDTLTVNGTTVVMHGVHTEGAQSYTGAATVAGNSSSESGNITFNNAVALGGTAAFDTATGNTDVVFANTLNGAHALTAATGTGNLRLQGVVGGSTPLASLANTGASVVTANVTTSGNQTYDTLAVGGNLTSTGGTIATGDMTLTANSTLNTSGGNGAITLGGTGAGAFNLTLNAGTGDVGIADDFSIGTLTLTAADDVTLAGDVVTTNAMDFTAVDDIILAAAVTLNAGSSNMTMDSGNTVSGAFDLVMVGATLAPGIISGVDDLTLTASVASNLTQAISTAGTQTYNGPTNLGINLTTTGDTITLNGATTLTADSTVNTAGGTLVMNSTLDGAHALTVNTGSANINLANTLGGSTPLTDLTLTTTGTLTANEIHLTGDLIAHAATLTFNQALLADNITLTGNATVLNPMTALTNLSITGDTSLGADLDVGGNLAILGDTTLTANVTMATGGGAGHTLTHTGNIGGDYNLTLVAGLGDVVMTGDVDINALTMTSVDDFMFGGGDIEADSGIDFSPADQILLGGDTNIYGRDGTTRADVTLGTSNEILATTTGVDLLIFGDLVTLYQVGDTGSGKLETLTIDANTAQILGNIYTTGAQTITAGQGLAGFLSSGGGDISLNTAANLVGDIVITTDGGDISINQPLNGPYAMNLNAGNGTVSINAALGNTTPLTNMTIVGQLINLTSPITTTGSQSYTGETNLTSILTIGFGDITYNSPVFLGGSGVIDTSGGNGTITFNDTVDGPYHLTLRAGSGGDINFNAPVGADTRVGSLTVESTENITFAYGAYVENYIQNRIDGLASFGFSPGLNASEGIRVATSRDLNGRYTGRDITLEADGLISGEVYATNTLNLTSGRTLLNGSVQGRVGRAAARLITFEGFNGGPHYFASLNLPIVDDFYATPSRMAGAPLATTLATPQLDGGAGLNPFATLPMLMLADAGVVDGEAEDVFAPWLGL